MANLLVWLDIPAKDLDRAIKFYSNVLSGEIKKETYKEGFSLGMLPGGMGCLYEEKKDIQNDIGPLVYFNVNGRIGEVEKVVSANGGEILQTKHQIGSYGWRVVAKDSEGNRIAFHSETE
jgi:predicted enzyme related to lactoylglutathione lyase